MYGKKNPGPIGVSPGATVGDMIQNSRVQQRRMQMQRAPKRVNADMLRTTVDFRSTPMKRGMR